MHPIHHPISEGLQQTKTENNQKNGQGLEVAGITHDKSQGAYVIKRARKQCVDATSGKVSSLVA